MRYLIICLLLFGCSDNETEVNELYGNWQLTFATIQEDTTYYEVSYDTLRWEMIMQIEADSIIRHYGEDNYSRLARYYEVSEDSLFLYVTNSEGEAILFWTYIYDIIDDQLIFDEVITWGEIIAYYNSVSNDSLNRFIERFGG